MTPEWTTTAYSCLNVARPPVKTPNTRNSRPAITAHMIRGAITIAATLRPVRHAGGSKIPFRVSSYIWSLTLTPNDSIRRIPSSSVACLPTSVDWNHIWQPPTTRMMRMAMPSQRGAAATAAYVSRGAVMMPTTRAARPKSFGAAGGPGRAVVSLMTLDLRGQTDNSTPSK